MPLVESLCLRDEPMLGGFVITIGLLGDVEMRVDDDLVDAGYPRQRAVLAALAVDLGRLVPTDALVERIWGPDAPASARATLHSHIARIRATLRHVSPVDDQTPFLHTRSNGYVLDGAIHQVDVHRFRRTVEDALTVAHDARRRARLLADALALWRGVPLSEIPGLWAADVRTAWERERVEAVLAWADAEVEAGRPELVVVELGSVLRDHPLNEAVGVALIRALTEAGRPSEALVEYERLRRRLAHEVGTDPNAELQSLYGAVLRGERAKPRSTRAAVLVPAQLPPSNSQFVGRRAALAGLDAMLAAPGQPASTSVAVVTALGGTAGIGKTTLALHWANRVASRFTDGQLYLNLRGFDPGGEPMSSPEALRILLDGLGVEASRIPADAAAQVNLYRSLVRDRRLLLVLDNARDADQVRPLLPGSTAAMVLITSRNPLTSLVATEGAHPLMLELFTEEEGRELLSTRLPGPASENREALNRVLRVCSRLPLALAIFAARGRQTGVTAGELADDLERQGLTALDAGDAPTRLRAVFRWSYDLISPSASRLFRLLSLHFGEDITVAAAASLLGEGGGQTYDALGELMRTGLLIERRPGHYTMHDLLRSFAAELVSADLGSESSSDATAGRARLFEHYLHTAHRADRMLFPYRDAPRLPLARMSASVVPEPLRTPAEAVAWFQSQHSAMLPCLRYAAAGDAERAWQLAWAMAYLITRGHWRTVTQAWEGVLGALSSTCSEFAGGYAHMTLSRAYTRLGDYRLAHAHFEASLMSCQRAGDIVGEADTLLTGSHLSACERRYDQAVARARRARDLYEAAEHNFGRATAENQVGWHLSQLGRHGESLEHCTQALALLEEFGDQETRAATLDSLGNAHHHLGHHGEAVRCYRQALEIVVEMEDPYHEAVVLRHLGETHRSSGDLRACREAWLRSHLLFTKLHHHEAIDLRAALVSLDDTIRVNGSTAGSAC
jgi:DNA-binding SARP family transcriptional activator/tetratricopeptide (TPR) repeat protein